MSGPQFRSRAEKLDRLIPLARALSIGAFFAEAAPVIWPRHLIEAWGEPGWYAHALSEVKRRPLSGNIGGWRLAQLQFTFLDWIARGYPEVDYLLSAQVLAACDERKNEEISWARQQVRSGPRRARFRNRQIRWPHEDVLPVHHDCGCVEPAVPLQFDARGNLFPEDSALVMAYWKQHLLTHPECLDRMAGRSAEQLTLL